MLVSSPQGRPAVPAGAEEEPGLRADLASRVLSGPGLWTDWLEDLDRYGLIQGLLGEGVIEEINATPPVMPGDNRPITYQLARRPGI